MFLILKIEHLEQDPEQILFPKCRNIEHGIKNHVKCCYQGYITHIYKTVFGYKTRHMHTVLTFLL
jgi:hypothetical protein